MLSPNSLYVNRGYGGFCNKDPTLFLGLRHTGEENSMVKTSSKLGVLFFVCRNLGQGKNKTELVLFAYIVA